MESVVATPGTLRMMVPALPLWVVVRVEPHFPEEALLTQFFSIKNNLSIYAP